jgi:pimeloyl-ACP methyl ester carboxylesterase
MALVPMRLLPQAELHVFPRCGHWTMIEAKEAWETTVLGFLRRGAEHAA